MSGEPSASQPVAWEYRELTMAPIERLMEGVSREVREGWRLVCVTLDEPHRALLERAVVEREP